MSEIPISREMLADSISLEDAIEMSQREPEIVERNGLYIDANTGEILSVAMPIQQNGEPEPFRVHDRESAEWVLEKIFEAEGEMSALDRRLETYTRNVEAMKVEHERRATWLRERFGAELEGWARRELEGQKKRSIRTPFGRLSFRRRGARVVVKDEAAALEWAKANQSNAIKTTERFLISAVPSDRMKIWQSGGPRPPCFDLEPEREAFAIETGIE